MEPTREFNPETQNIRTLKPRSPEETNETIATLIADLADLDQQEATETRRTTGVMAEINTKRREKNSTLDWALAQPGAIDPRPPVEQAAPLESGETSEEISQ